MISEPREVFVWTWLPEEGKGAIQKWVSAYRTGCSDFKKQMDDNYAKVDTFFDKV